MKTTLILSILLLASCAHYGTDKQGNPSGTFVGAKASKIVHTPQGFYAEGLDTQTGFKDLMDFSGLTVGGYFTNDFLKTASNNSIAVDRDAVKAGVKATGMKEQTKQVGIREATKVRAIDAAAAAAQ